MPFRSLSVAALAALCCSNVAKTDPPTTQQETDHTPSPLPEVTVIVATSEPDRVLEARCEPASLHALLLLTLSSISQFETNTKRIAGIHRVAIFGRGAIMPRARLCESQSTVVEPRTSGRFDERRLGNEAPPTVDAYADRRNPLFSHTHRSVRVEIRGTRESNSRPSRHAIHHFGH
jgi:hypothetical protein